MYGNIKKNKSTLNILKRSLHSVHHLIFFYIFFPKHWHVSWVIFSRFFRADFFFFFLNFEIDFTISIMLNFRARHKNNSIALKYGDCHSSCCAGQSVNYSSWLSPYVSDHWPVGKWILAVAWVFLEPKHAKVPSKCSNTCN